MWALVLGSVAGIRALFAEAPPEITPRYVVIDLGPQMTSPVKISAANVVLGHGFHSAWLSWSDGTLTPLPRDDIPAHPTSGPNNLALPQPKGAVIIPLKKIENVPQMWDRKGVPAARQSTTQVIGNGPDGAYLWEKETGKNFGAPIPLNLLVPEEKAGVPWNITSVTDINSGGTMVGIAIHTLTGPDDPIAAGPRGVMIQPMAVVREVIIGGGDFGPITDNGLDDKATIPIYATESGKGQWETDKSDDFSASIYGGIRGPVRATLIYKLKTRSDQSDTGTLSETAAGSGVFEDKSTQVRVEILPLDNAPSDAIYYNALVRDPKLGITGDSHFLRQDTPTSDKYTDNSPAVDVILKGPLSTTAINLIDLQMSGDIGGADTLTETAVNSRVFKGPDGLTVSLADYKGAPGGPMAVRISNGFLKTTHFQFTLPETSATSLQYSTYVRVIGDAPVSTPATDGQGIFYIELTGTRATEVTIASGDSHVKVEAVPVKGRPNLLRTGKLVLIEKGDPFRAPGITTIEAGGREIDFQMKGQTVVK